MGQDACHSNKTELRRRSAMVFQEGLFLQDTVFGNVAWGLKLRGMASSDIKKKVYEALIDFRCDHLAMRPIYSLSGGEAQRISIARALAVVPELLLLDEAFSAQDVVVRQEMIGELRQLAEDMGMTVMLVSHNFPEVLHFANRIIVMLSGRIVQDNTPETVLRRPVNVEVAKLVGMDNMIPCCVKEGSKGRRIELINGISFFLSSNCSRAGNGLLSARGCTVPLERTACSAAEILGRYGRCDTENIAWNWCVSDDR